MSWMSACLSGGMPPTSAATSGFLMTRTRGSPVTVSSARPVLERSIPSIAATIRFAPNVVRVIGILLGGVKGPPKIAPPSLLEQGRSDHEALDLVRPLVNLGDLRVAKFPLRGKVPQVAVASK